MQDTKKLQPWLLLTGAVAILLASLAISKRNLDIATPASGQNIPPLEVKIVNQNEQGFSVVWLTKEAVKGYVVYSTSRDQIQQKETVEPKVGDRRGNYNYYSHLVTVDNLSPGETYFFKIINGDNAYYLATDGYWREVGIAETVKIPVNPGWSISAYSLEPEAFSSCVDWPEGKMLLSCYRPNIIWGQVNDLANQPVNDGLVIIDIPGKTNLVGTTVDSNGRWSINLGNLWNENLTDYATYLPGTDLIRVRSLAKDAKASVYQPIPSVVSEKSSFLPITIKLQNAPLVNPQMTTSPTLSPTPILVLSITPTPTVGLSNNASQTTNPNQITMQINFPPKNTPTLKGKIELKDKTGRWFNINVVFKRTADNQYTGVFAVSRSGEYELAFQPEGYLKTILGKYQIKVGTNSFESNRSEWVGGDANADNQINILDIGIVLANYQKVKVTANTDFNGDGISDILDLALLVSNYHGI